jgi:hypothetical protein
MSKVQKDTIIELMAKFTEFFEADTVEKATEAADMDNDARTKDAQGSGIEATKDVRENV